MTNRIGPSDHLPVNLRRQRVKYHDDGSRTGHRLAEFGGYEQLGEEQAVCELMIRIGFGSQEGVGLLHQRRV